MREGDRVRSRGLTLQGVVAWVRGNWAGVDWDDGAAAPTICHVTQLKKIEQLGVGNEGLDKS